MSKGSWYRTYGKKFRQNYERIFEKKEDSKIDKKNINRERTLK